MIRAVLKETWSHVSNMTMVPEPVREPGCSLVAMQVATVSHLDLTIASGNFPVHPQLPYIPGVEGAGEVIQSDTWAVGASVCVRGNGVGITRNGTWGEIVNVPDEALVPWPAGLDAGLAASYFVPATTAYVAIHDICAVSGVNRVLVTGASGAVGSLAVQLALAAGASVVALTRTPDSWNGPSHPQLKVCKPTDDVVALAGGLADCMIETVAGSGFDERLRWLSPGAVCALVGYAAGALSTIDIPSLILHDIQITPVNMLRREIRARGIAPALAELIQRGDLTMGVTEFDLTEVSTALEHVRRGGLGGRAVLRVRD